MVNLFKGHPSEGLLPREQVIQATRNVLSPEVRRGDSDEEIRHPLTYGSDPGAITVREAIAKWSNGAHGEQKYGIPDPGSINLTNGASYGAQIALQQATYPFNGYTRRAFIVSPTYFLITTIFDDAGFKGKTSAVPEHEGEGVDLDYFESQLRHYDSLPAEADLDSVYAQIGGDRRTRKVYRYVLYLVPTFSNPTGSTMSLGDRQRLISIARRHDVLVLCDDVYDLLDFNHGEGAIPRLVTLDRHTGAGASDEAGDEANKGTSEPWAGNVVSNCTVSKLLGPGLRVGWHETASPALATQFSQGGAIKSGGTPSHLNTMIVGDIIKTGAIDDIIANLRNVYGARAKAVAREIRAKLPPGTSVQGGSGGYFIWVTLPKGYDSTAISKRAKELGVVVAALDNFLVEGETPPADQRSFRISFSYESVERSLKGIEIWAQAIRELGPTKR